MANIISEVLNLNCMDNAQQTQLRDSLIAVEGKISGLKTELLEAMELVFVLSEADLDRVTTWGAELSGMQKLLKEITGRYEKDKKALQTASDNLDLTADNLEESDKTIEILQKLVEVVRNIEVALPEEDLAHAGRALKQSETILLDIESSFESAEDAKWKRSLKYFLQERMHFTSKYTAKLWGRAYKFESKGLIINQDICDIPDLVETMENVNIFEKNWSKFCDQIWEELLSNIFTLDYGVQVMPMKNERPNLNRTGINKSVIDKTKYYDQDYVSPMLENEDDLDLTLSLSEQSFEVQQFSICAIKCKRLNSPITQVAEVCKSVTDVISLLRTSFQDRFDIIEKLSARVSPKLCDALNKCVKTLILKNSNGNMNKARQDFQALQNFMDHLGKNLDFHVDRTTLDNLEKTFDSQFLSQIREDLMVKIRSLVKSDMLVMEEHIPDDINVLDVVTDEIATFHKHPFRLPKCTISKSIADLVKVLKNHKKNYPSDTTMNDHAFNLYLALVTVPKSESEAEDMVPLLAVLIHNNSLYLCHHASISFVGCEDKIQLLRSKASQSYSFMMRSIRTKLNGMISEAMTGLEERLKISNDEVYKKFMAISSEFNRLDNVFKNVLPSRIWQRTLATLVDHTVNEMCSKVLSWDDITATTANELATSFTRFSLSTSELFKGDAKSSREIDVYTSKIVSKWQRFRLLTFVITASMKEIEDKWVDGCGPLALAFTAEEVRKLVRALFQNTDHRAAFLANIKESSRN